MDFLCFQDESHARAASRASSHKSQEDITRSSSRSRLKLLEKPAEPPKKGISSLNFFANQTSELCFSLSL